MNVVKQGPFYSVEEIVNMDEEDSELDEDKVEKAFNAGKRLPPHIISQIQRVIDDCFIDKLMKDDKPIDKFGSDADSYTDKIDEYKLAVLNTLMKWKTKYENDNGSLDIELNGRVAYALRYDDEGNAPRPLLTKSYIIALDMILERIPNCIREVSILSAYFHTYCLQYDTSTLPCIRSHTNRSITT